MARLVELVREIDGEGRFSPAGVALIAGLNVTDVKAWWGLDVVAADLPKDWKRQGRRRSSEAKAATGSSNVVAALRYWAVKDYAADVEVDGNSVWLIDPQAVPL